MTRLVAGLIAFFVASNSVADDLPLEGGRYPGHVIEFELTAEQIGVIYHFRECHLERFKTMNKHTPYIFSLSPTQAATLVERVGYSPEHFAVYETYRGYNDAGPHWNLALRYSEDHIEIPISLLLRDADAEAAQRVQGWLPSNPCFSSVSSR